MLRSKVVGAIQSNQERVVKGTKGIHDTSSGQGVAEGGEDGEEGVGRDRVEQIADLVIARDVRDAKERLSVGATFGVAQGALMGKEGWGLRKEDGKGSQGSIFDRELSVLAAACVRQEVKLGMQCLDEGLKAERVCHGCSVV